MPALHTSTPLEIRLGMSHHFGSPVDEVPLQMLASILPTFRKTSLQAMLAMRHALSCRDGHRLHLAAKAMKGSSKKLGLDRLPRLCEKMEMLAQERAFAAAALELRLLAAEYRQVQQVCDDLLAGA